MVAVAVVAGLFGTRSLIEQRREMYRQLARASERNYLLAMVDLSCEVHPEAGCKLPEVDPEDDGLPRSADEYRQRARFFRLQKDKYQRAVRYPWLPVAPDPPEPEATSLGAMGDPESNPTVRRVPSCTNVIS
jgi:hypothetical protein